MPITGTVLTLSGHADAVYVT